LSSVASSIGPVGVAPALLTRISASAKRSASAATEPRSIMSQAWIAMSRE